ncbi:hypothetical protein Y032_0253g250 [Ancylostoma ceylanicum]|uniref:Uncharacterized protein n=1 Tax=Ancylostoma ceylanicum TaxID=53326 RepID=A0A016SCC7_9BILA|nr:hypothetical protein Y032_0253g250 [Ancylostoma ceylanicum]
MQAQFLNLLQTRAYLRWVCLRCAQFRSTMQQKKNPYHVGPGAQAVEHGSYLCKSARLLNFPTRRDGWLDWLWTRSNHGLCSAVSSATVSPANGSYAPKQLTSPSNGVLHKSQSVGADLAGRGEDPRNGKRKLEDNAGNGTSTPSSGMKRTKTAIGSLASPITPTVSVLAARKAVQSTKDLVAELSQNLPEHMSIDSSIREHEERVKREQQDEEYALQLYGGASTSTPYSQPERKKRKYERKMKPSEPSPDTNTGIICKLSFD